MGQSRDRIMTGLYGMSYSVNYENSPPTSTPGEEMDKYEKLKKTQADLDAYLDMAYSRQRRESVEKVWGKSMQSTSSQQKAEAWLKDFEEDRIMSEIGQPENSVNLFSDGSPVSSFWKDAQVLDPAKSKIGKQIVDSKALHPDFTKNLAKVAQVSVEKGYEHFNWLSPESTTRVSTFIEAGARHVYEAKKGYDTNTEKKLDGSPIPIRAHHLVYAAYNYLMAAQIINDLPEHDDRLWINGELKDGLGGLE